MTERLKNGHWKKGVSPNPGGRPAVVDEVRDLARKFTTEAIESLAHIMRYEKTPAQARVAAAVAILDRGYGKPGQSVDLNANVKNDLSDLLDQISGQTRGLPNGSEPIQ